MARLRHTSSGSVSRSRSKRKAPAAKASEPHEEGEEEAPPVVHVAVEEHLLVGHDHVGHRVEAQGPPQQGALRDRGVAVDDRRREEPQVQHVGQDALQVAEVHGERGEEEGEAEGEDELDEHRQREEEGRPREPALPGEERERGWAGRGGSARGSRGRSPWAGPRPGRGPS